MVACRVRRVAPRLRGSVRRGLSRRVRGPDRLGMADLVGLRDRRCFRGSAVVVGPDVGSGPDAGHERCIRVPRDVRADGSCGLRGRSRLGLAVARAVTHRTSPKLFPHGLGGTALRSLDTGSDRELVSGNRGGLAPHRSCRPHRTPVRVRSARPDRTSARARPGQLVESIDTTVSGDRRSRKPGPGARRSVPDDPEPLA